LESNLKLVFGMDIDMNTWKLAYQRGDQAEKAALQYQHIQQALAARKIARRESKRGFLSLILAIKDSILYFG
jgi:hypothetical protein